MTQRPSSPRGGIGVLLFLLATTRDRDAIEPPDLPFSICKALPMGLSGSPVLCPIFFYLVSPTTPTPCGLLGSN